MLNGEKKKIERFEDLIAWQKTRELTRRVYQITRQGGFSKDYRLASQIQSACVSCMSNIAEGFERGGRGEFHQFLSMAKGSAAEVRSLLYVGLDAGYITEAQFKELSSIAKEAGRIIGASGLPWISREKTRIGKKIGEHLDSNKIEWLGIKFQIPFFYSVLSPQHSVLSHRLGG